MVAVEFSHNFQGLRMNVDSLPEEVIIFKVLE